MTPTHATVQYRKGRPSVGYLYLRERPITSTRTRQLNDGLIADFDADGTVLGLELLEPRSFTLDAINGGLASVGVLPLAHADLPEVLAKAIEDTLTPAL